MIKRKSVLLIMAIAFALVTVSLLNITVNVRAKNIASDDKIPERVFFDEIDVGGMSKEEAKSATQEYIRKVAETKLVLNAGKNQLEVTAAQLGLTWSNPEIIDDAVGLLNTGNLISRYKALKDLEHDKKVYKVAFQTDAAIIKSLIESNAEVLNTQAVDAGLKRENGNFIVVEGSQGVTVNTDASVKVIETYFSEGLNQEEKNIELVADVVDPRGTEEELSKVQSVLGTFNTSFGSSNAARSKNVDRGAELINGSVIYPGDEFSVYEAVAPFNAENGYDLAGSYENGTTVQTYGGGICQVSTTLYNSVIRAELDITERFEHSMTVNYVEASADAAIAGTYKDLKFKNNSNAPIYIEGYTESKVIYFTIYGEEYRPENRTIEFVSKTTSTQQPGVEFRAVGQAIGHKSTEQNSRVGATAELWKIVRIDGVEQSNEQFNKSNYKASPRIVNVGIASAVPDASAAVNAAVATQNEGAINAAIAQWSNSAIAARQQAEADAAAAQAEADAAAAQAEADAAAQGGQEAGEQPLQEVNPEENSNKEDNDKVEDVKEEE